MTKLRQRPCLKNCNRTRKITARNLLSLISRYWICQTMSISLIRKITLELAYQAPGILKQEVNLKEVCLVLMTLIRLPKPEIELVHLSTMSLSMA